MWNIEYGIVFKYDNDIVYIAFFPPELSLKIGIDEGEIVVVQHAYDKSSQIDVLGYVLIVTAKIILLTDSNRLSVGENVYKLLHPDIQTEFHELVYGIGGWDYINRDTGKLYKVYTLN